MIDFAKLRGLSIPEGVVTQITDESGKVLWKAIKYYYVTLGDSVGAGYGVENAEDDFTGLLGKELEKIYGTNKVSVKNKAIGGHKIPDLMARLDETDVYNAVKRANLVTISIGGNDMLFPAFNHLEDYIFSGDSALEKMTSDCMNTLNNTLAKDDYPTSYNNLFKKLVSINPNAKIVFTTQYNPYKYLWVEEGENGFFKPLFDTLPNNLGLVGDLFKAFVRESFFGMELVKNFFNRINGLDEWVENLVNELNRTLKLKMGEFNNSNFFVAETKALYDSITDRQGAGEIHYNDLVHVEYSRGYNFGDIDWGMLWNNTQITDKNGNVLSGTVCNSAYDFWSTLISVYWNGSSIDTTGLTETLLYMVATLVVMPNVDLHPKEDGYYLLMRSFADTLRNNVSELQTLPTLNTITYNANGGTGWMATQKALDICRGKMVYSITTPNTFSPTTTGYYYNGWKDGSGNSYSDGQAIYVAANTNLYAQWSNMYTVTWKKKTTDTELIASNLVTDQTGPVYKNGSEYYLRVTLNDNVIPYLGDKFDINSETPKRSMQVPYGTPLYVQLINTGSYDRGHVKLNGVKQGSNSEYTYFNMTIKHDTSMVFYWEYELGYSDGFIPLPEEQNYWLAEITEYPRPTNNSTMILDSGVLDKATLG